MNYKVFLINLDRSTERLEKAAQQLNRLNVPFERIAAVDGSQLTKAEIDTAFDIEQAERRTAYNLTIGEMGCYLSHVNCWRRIIAEALDFAIVLEDDLVLDDDFPKAIAEIEQLTQTQAWDYIKLANPFKKRPYQTRLLINNFTLVDYPKAPTGTVAQAVSLKGAHALLAHRPPFFRAIDVDLQWEWELGIQVQGLVPYVANVSDAESEIQQMAQRKDLKQRRWTKLKESIKFKLKKASHR
ncbi:glycosyl transferase [Idiomarina sp. MD25a]|uniref:glycosyltransferase family 25 protein n=1 Tax=Idiomarina sp. MD25a TaxID=1889913 RepID=UPI0008F7EC80|nr:glycosyltransferase family 25 protein [Idiomarina sp. MD25a]OIM99389.1 glycosyl transferase [Idiomarina sp. MD25a]